jgi:hypothetical protein
MHLIREGVGPKVRAEQRSEDSEYNRKQSFRAA